MSSPEHEYRMSVIDQYGDMRFIYAMVERQSPDFTPEQISAEVFRIKRETYNTLYYSRRQ